MWSGCCRELFGGAAGNNRANNVPIGCEWIVPKSNKSEFGQLLAGAANWIVNTFWHESFGQSLTP